MERQPLPAIQKTQQDEIAVQKIQQRPQPERQPGKTWVYLYDWLGIDEVARLEPKPGIPPSGAHLQAVLETIRRTPARMVVYSAYEGARASEWLAERARIPVVQLPLSVGGAPGADDLFGLYEVTLDRLLQAAGA